MTKRREPWSCQACGSLGMITPRAYPRSVLCASCHRATIKAGKRWCARGGHAVQPDQFSGSAAYCKGCISAYNAQKRATRTLEARAESRAWYQANMERAAAYRKTYYQEKRAQILAQKKQYYQRKRAQIVARMRAYRARGIPPASLARMQERQRVKKPIYRQNEKLARARRFVQALRGQGVTR